MIYKLSIATAADYGFLQEELNKKFSWLKQHGYFLSIQSHIIQRDSSIIFDLMLHGSTTAAHLKDEDIVYIFKHQISEFLAEHIVRDWEDRLAWKEVSKKSRHIPPGDQITIYKKAIEFLKRCNSNESLNLLMNYGRKNKIAHKILDYIYYHDLLVMDGFINFCMKDYLVEIKFAVDLAYEELKNEKEYNEFVKLLRYFVDTQPPTVVEVNILMDKHGRFSLWDGNGTRLEPNHVNYYLDDIARGEITLDDMLVSILITIAPRRIVLHNVGAEPRNESVKMIKTVFEKRISECSGCERCFEHQPGEGRTPNKLEK